MLKLKKMEFLLAVLISVSLEPLSAQSLDTDGNWPTIATVQSGENNTSANPVFSALQDSLPLTFSNAAESENPIISKPSRLNTNKELSNKQLAAVSSPDPRAKLADSLADDVSLQNATIIALRRALGARQQISVTRRGKFSDEIRPYIETYRGLSATNILANIQKRYSDARSDLIEARLPDTIEELVAILESLQ